MEEFATDAAAAIRKRMETVHVFAADDARTPRPYVRMIVERMFPTLPILSQLEIARGFEIKSLGTIARKVSPQRTRRSTKVYVSIPPLAVAARHPTDGLVLRERRRRRRPLRRLLEARGRCQGAPLGGYPWW